MVYSHISFIPKKMEREDSQEPPRITGGKPNARAVSDSSAIRRRNSHNGPKYITLGFKDSSPIYIQ